MASLDTRPVFPRRNRMTLEGHWLEKSSFFGKPTPNPTDFINESSTIPTNTAEKLVVVEHYIGSLGGVEKCTSEISRCALCHKANGNCHFFFDNFCWPSGYIHYLRDHHTVPSIEFESALSKWYAIARKNETPVQNEPITLSLITAQDEILREEKELKKYFKAGSPLSGGAHKKKSVKRRSMKKRRKVKRKSSKRKN